MKATNADLLADDPAVERLVAAGRRRGYVTFEELRQALPIATMSEAAIAQAVSRLEQAGIIIDVDDELVEPAHGGEPGAERPAQPMSGGVPEPELRVLPMRQVPAVRDRKAGPGSPIPNRKAARVAALVAAATLAALVTAGLFLV